MILVLNLILLKNVALSGVSTSVLPSYIRIIDHNTDSSMSLTALVFPLLVTSEGVYPTNFTF